MAGYRKKRRGPQGPNKNEKKVLRSKDAQKQALAAGLLSEKFPSIKRLSVHLVFRSAQQQLLDEKTLQLGPTDPCLFAMPCPGRCGTGSFDFTGKVEEAARSLLPSSDSSGKCAKPIFVGSSDLCGCELKCRMDLEYFPDAVPEPQEPAAAAPQDASPAP
ncbi:MAG: hypothetical protein HY922_02305 [Elusimicrobia bacterium]|nr:hypothetical protein [Elusimicrobiota bacterium]